jgi:hypothetical protein
MIKRTFWQWLVGREPAPPASSAWARSARSTTRSPRGPRAAGPRRPRPRRAALLAGFDDQRLDLTPLGLGLDLIFHRGRPLLGRGSCSSVTFNAEPLGDVRVQLIHKDRIVADGEEIDVA